MEDVFEVTGLVVHGKQLGSKLGFPTANIQYHPDSHVWPSEGVYVGIATVEGDSRSYVAILNQGKHPTAPGGEPTLEAHLLGYQNQTLYGKQLRLRYCAFLRPECTFPSLEALTNQLACDREKALVWAKEHAPHLLEELDPSLPNHST